MLLSLETIEEAFSRLDRELKRLGERAEIYLVGGAVMCLVHKARPSTKDIDGWFSNAAVLRKAAEIVAKDLELPPDWLNDGAKGFLPEKPGVETWKELECLTVSNVDAATLFAMKCLAARTSEDTNDIRFLAKLLKVDSASAALTIVSGFYPEDRISVRTRLLLEELFS